VNGSLPFEIQQLFELLDQNIKALSESIESMEEGASLLYQFPDMQGSFLCMRRFTRCINVEMDMSLDTFQDPQGQCKHSFRDPRWTTLVTVTTGSDIDYVVDLIEQAYVHNLRREVKTMSDEEVIRKQDLEIVRDSNTLVIRFPEVLGDLAGTTVIEVRFEGEQISRFEMRRELPTIDTEV